MEFPVTLCQHAFPVLSLFVHRGIQDDDSPSRAQAAARFLQSSMVVRGIVERGIEDREIELRIRKGHPIELRFNQRESFVEERVIVPRGPEPVQGVG